MNELNGLIIQRLKSKPKIKRIMGVIKKVIENTNDTKYQVSIFDKDDNKQNVILLNKTKDMLQKDDVVWVYYWKTVTDGYIAIKIGLSSFGSKCGSVIVRPLHCEAAIIDSYKFNKKSNLISNTYTYSLESQSIQESRSPFPYTYTHIDEHYTIGTGIMSNGMTLHFGTYSPIEPFSQNNLYPTPYIYKDISVALVVGTPSLIRAFREWKNVRFTLKRIDRDVHFIASDDDTIYADYIILEDDILTELGFCFGLDYSTVQYNGNQYISSHQVIIAQKVGDNWRCVAWLPVNLRPLNVTFSFQTDSISVSSNKTIVTQNIHDN